MTPWLAIDTSAGTAVAIVHNGEVLASVNIDDTMGHAENIGNALQKVLAQAKLAPADINAVVVGRGPAPFTGLRVGIAAAITFAAGIGRPIFSVVSHDAIAHAELVANPTAEPLLVTTDARRREIYWSLYSGLDSNGAPVRIDGPHVSSAEACEELLAQKGLSPARTNSNVQAEHLALVAIAQAKRDELSHDLTPLYLRAPDAVEPKSHARPTKSGSK